VDLLEVNDLDKCAPTGQLLGKLFFLRRFATPPSLVVANIPDIPETSRITLKVSQTYPLVAFSDKSEVTKEGGSDLYLKKPHRRAVQGIEKGNRQEYRGGLLLLFTLKTG
jgi:hypothetical protein